MRIAIVGAGVSGLVAAHLLAPEHELVVHEADARIGGHTNTVRVEADGRAHAVDTGFIVFNDRTYPNFARLMDRLGVASQPSDMSFSVRSETTGLEYNGTSFNSLFAQRSNLLRPRFWRMVRDILRFNREAPRVLDEPGPGPSIRELVERGGYSEQFARDYLLPMGAAIWSASRDQMLACPARFFVRFFANHGFLSVDDRPTWRVLVGGSRAYLEPLTAPFADRIRAASPVERVERDADGVTVTPLGGAPERYDHVVLATHSDQALALLGDPTDAEREVLGALAYRPNEAVLHTDERVMPRRRLAWAAWNYHQRDAGDDSPVAVTYWMNRLQGLDTPTQLFVTLNRGDAIDPARVLRRIPYHHPVFTHAGVAAQARWGEVSSHATRTWYCGAYWRNGFHEDGVVSGLRVAEAFGRSL